MVVDEEGDLLLRERVEELEIKYDGLYELIKMVDEYSRHIMNQTMVQISIMIAIATGVILIAAYFMIKQIINNQVDKEIERKVLNALKENPPIHFAQGKAKPDENNKIYLTGEIEGDRRSSTRNNNVARNQSAVNNLGAIRQGC